MSLQTRLEALVSAIGADVKQLKTDVAAAGGGSGTAPANMVTTDTSQLITGPKHLAPTTRGAQYASGTATNNGGGAGTYTGALLVEPSSALADQTGVLIKAPSSGWGVGQDYSEGQALLYIDENRNVRCRIARDGGIGTTGGLHVGLGANGGAIAGITQAAWIDTSNAPDAVPMVIDAAAASTVDSLLVRRGAEPDPQLQVDRYGNVRVGAAMSFVSVGNASYICNNCYFDGTNWRYRKNGTAGLIGISIFDPVNANFSAVAGVAGGIISWLLVSGAEGQSVWRKTAAQTITGTAFANVLQSDNIPPGAYAFEINGSYRGSTTAQGLRARVSPNYVGATAGLYQANMMTATSATANNNTTTTTIAGTLGSATASLTTNLPFQITGSVHLAGGSSCNFLFSVASSTTGSIIIEAGTYMRLMRTQQ